MIRLNLNDLNLDGYPTEEEIMDAIMCLPGFDPYLCTGGAQFEWRTAADWVWLWEHVITHIEGPIAGKPYILQQHEKAILSNTMGWINTDVDPERYPEGMRRFSDVFYYVPQGNSKSTFAAGWITLITAFDTEAGAQNVSTASTRKQASVVKRIVKGMIDNSPELTRKMKVFQFSITVNDRTFQTLSAEAKSAHGYNIYLLINDEVHAHQNSDFLDVVRKKAQKRPNSLRIYITTADFIRENSVCNTFYDRSKKILEGSIDVPSFLPAIYEISQERMRKDPECWKDPKLWYEANPLLGKALAFEDFEQIANEAMQDPALQNEFLRLCLNVRTDQKVKMIDMGKWINVCSGPYNFADFKDQEPAGVGLDLGQTSDFTVMCVLYDLPVDKKGNRQYVAFWFHWTPEVTAREREIRMSGANYETWARDGWMKLTDGDETDWNEILRDITADEIPKDVDTARAHYPGMDKSLATSLGIKKMAIDRLFQGHQLSQDIGNEGIEVIEFGQGFVSMAAPTLEFVKLVKSGRLKHGDNPVMRWQVSHLMAKMDAAGLMKPDKSKSGDKIDGVVALIMAIGIAMQRDKPPESLLEKYGGIVYV